MINRDGRAACIVYDIIYCQRILGSICKGLYLELKLFTIPSKFRIGFSDE